MTIAPPVTDVPLRYVGFWTRVWASLVDSLLLLVLLVPVGWLVFDANLLDTTGSASDGEHFVLTTVVPAMVVLVYWMRRQSTPGKLLFHARIVDAETGRAPRAAQLVVRYLGYYLSAFVLGLGFVWIAFDPRKQGWHDKLANTLVVRATDGD